MRPRPDRVPNRLTAAARAHRSAAQNGQYWPPMYSTSGFPPAVRAGWPVTASNPVAVPAPTALNVAGGTLVACCWTRAVVPGPAAWAGPLRAGDWPSFTAVSVAASAVTTATLPPASRTRPRTWALRWAARFPGAGPGR